MKHDTTFEFKQYKWWQIWKNGLELDTKKCLDCKYPHRWDEIRKSINDFIKSKKK